ncbi:MAG: amidohydrolase [Clostridiales bacterium]|nr:amidohydrolase [Clostridiales bacterium]
MIFKNITVLDENLDSKENCCVRVSGAKITYIGDTMPVQDDGERVYDGRGKLLMSGFYNAHGHSPMSLMRGYGENMSLQDWLNKKIFPFEDKLDSDAVYWATMLTMAESFRYGIVSTSDMYYFCDDMARAVIESGAKANIARSLTNFTGQDPVTMASFKEAVKFYEDFHGTAGGRLKADMSLHAEYTSDFATAKALADYSRGIDTVMQIHVSETLSEHEECKERHGLTPAAYLEKAGLFDVPAVAAHCVYSTDEDLEIFREKGVTVATNPVSNMKLASGICDAAGVLEHGVNLAIGTDSVASNNSLDFTEEMKVLAIGSKIARRDPSALSPKQVLRAATEGGAKAQQRNDCGVLKEGNRADLAVFDISTPNMHPVHDIVNNMVYSVSGSDVVLTMIDGRVVYENGEYTTMDIEKVIWQAEKSTKEILERL